MFPRLRCPKISQQWKYTDLHRTFCRTLTKRLQYLGNMAD